MNRRCTACDGVLGDGGLEKSGFRYSTCSTCGSASLVEGWDTADYEVGYFSAGTSYGYYDYASDSRVHLETANRRLDAVTTSSPGPGSLVDVGAALGFTLQAARDRGIEPVGVEISAYARDQLRQQGYDAHPSLDDLPPRVFDAVIFGQVLEHMPRPDRELATAHEIIRPGGVLFIETWDYSSRTARRFGSRWQQISPPSVVHLFTAAGLRRALERSGFTDIEIRPWQKRVSVNGALGVMAAKIPPRLGRTVMSVARATRISRIALTYKFDDLIAVTARKPD